MKTNNVTAPLIFLLLGIAFLSVGTVVKKKDPILETQTGPISYSEKAKEQVEGKKGPPVPTLELYPKERFLVEGPVEKGEGAPSIEEDEPLKFKLKAKKDDTREKSASRKRWFLDTKEG